jgi:restriction endonuclease
MVSTARCALRATGRRFVLPLTCLPQAVSVVLVKVHSPVVLDALADALRCVYWYKKDLRSFVLRVGVPSEFIGRLDWTNEHKRELVRQMLDALSRQPDRGTGLISKLTDAVVEMEDFAHLARLDDGERMVRDAADAIRRLRELLGRESGAEREERKRAARRIEAERRKAELVARQASIASLAAEFARLHSMEDRRGRGVQFEEFLRSLFALHDLEPRGAFSIAGEQTDGSIRLDSQLFLVEARWREDPSSPDDIRSFRGKVEEKLDNTLGIFISMSYFTSEAIKRAAVPPAKVILVDGQDLAPVMQGLVDLVEMLRRKVRRAAETGEVLSRFLA